VYSSDVLPGGAHAGAAAPPARRPDACTRFFRASRVPSLGTSQEKEMLRGDVEATDRAIDALVYKLYGLTEEEIKIVEGK
jgi:hypothetical protein